MEINVILQAISTIGLPAVLCVIFVRQQLKNDDYYKRMLEKMRETIDNNSKAIENLTEVIKEHFQESDE